MFEFLGGVAIGSLISTFIWIMNDIKHSEDNK